MGPLTFMVPECMTTDCPAHNLLISFLHTDLSWELE
uniref:Uncharacterized protein n=1 Tax=Arundo donax TaxID=35708 RepID=A0A0A8ZXH8_ARUDO